MNTLDFLPAAIKGMWSRASSVGSLQTCNPPPEGADIDILLLARSAEELDKLLEACLSIGFIYDDSYVVPMEKLMEDKLSFQSLRRGQDNLNLIITASVEFFKRFEGATKLATRLNLQNKEDRIALFQAILYKNYRGS